MACEKRTTITQLRTYNQAATDKTLPAVYGPNRVGDIPHSLADTRKAKERLGYQVLKTVKEGMKAASTWYREKWF